MCGLTVRVLTVCSVFRSVTVCSILLNTSRCGYSVTVLIVACSGVYVCGRAYAICYGMMTTCYCGNDDTPGDYCRICEQPTTHRALAERYGDLARHTMQTTRNLDVLDVANAAACFARLAWSHAEAGTGLVSTRPDGGVA